MNKKKIFISILIVLSIVIAVTGITFAFFVGRTNEEDVDAGAGKLDIIYTIDDNLSVETLEASSGREDGILSIATARLNNDSVKGNFNLYITPTNLTDVTDSDLSALKWEVDIINDDDTTTVKGDFSTATVDTPIKIIDKYELLYTDTTFNIYVWLNGNEIDSNDTGTNLETCRFAAVISADSVNISGDVE